MKKQREQAKKNRIGSQDRKKNDTYNSFPIAGIGASAGSFAALEKFFQHLPFRAGIGFVIIMHLDPNHKGSIAAVIQKYTRLPVCQAEDGVEILPDHVYVI